MSELMHYGIPRRSGRYPWGSGENPRQGTRAYYTGVDEAPRHTGKYKELDKDNPKRYENIRKKYDQMRAKGLNKPQIANELGMSAAKLTALLSIERGRRLQEQYKQVEELRAQGITNRSEISRRLGVGESTLRAWENKDFKEDPVQIVADQLRDQVAKKKYIDVGENAELSLYVNGKPISKSRLESALEVLRDEGYLVTNVQVPVGTDKKKQTTFKTLAAPGTTYQELKGKKGEILTIDDNYISEGEEKMSKTGIPPIHSVKRDRIMVKYDEDGGSLMDGVIQLRRGVPDLSLGSAAYAQVRIPVEDKWYLKGMAVYSDDMPPGVDIIFNSNKKRGTPDEKTFKPLETIKKGEHAGEVDMENPFKSAIKLESELRTVPRYYTDENGKQQVSPINVVNEEGDWKEWSKTVSAQMLAKQPKELIKMQLGVSVDKKKMEYAEICSVTNPVIKRELLLKFAGDCEGTAEHLKAVNFPHQASHVLLPLPDMPSDKIFAPNYENGTKVALVRYPHAGTFEIPVLTVDNNNVMGRKMIGKNSPDAVGIPPKAFAQLSGADADGDTAMVIPFSNSVVIKSDDYLSGLVGFDPKKEYAIDRKDPKQDKIKKCTEATKQKNMGVTTNLIMDMSGRAPEEDMVMAVKHSMVIIDSEKHDLDYRRSEKDNRLEYLRETYQRQPDGTIGGASTFMTRAKSPVYGVPTRAEKGIDPETGRVIYRDPPKDSWIDKKTGERRHRTFKSTQMKEVIASGKDPSVLVSQYNTPAERAYADYARTMISMANEARKEYLATEVPPKNKAAEKAYAAEVASLNAQLLLVRKNAPKERRAKRIADTAFEKEREKFGEMKEKEERRIRARALSTARLQVGAQRPKVKFTDKEWEAIQAHAISPTKLKELVGAADMDDLRERAMPKQRNGLTQAKIETIQRLAKRENGPTNDEIASILGLDPSDVKNALYPKKKIKKGE